MNTDQEDPEAEGYRDWIIDALEREPEALIDGIKRIFNCTEVEVSDVGDIYIDGHWLKAEGIIIVGRAIAKGDI